MCVYYFAVFKSAVGWDHKETTEKHSSQKDYSTGFGGKYGVQKDRQDKVSIPARVLYYIVYFDNLNMHPPIPIGWNDPRGI
ncbi:unnamed protein product [Trichobilharzia regenti]|nr:unnamed protein product [Trichobilharzia regenti]